MKEKYIVPCTWIQSGYISKLPMSEKKNIFDKLMIVMEWWWGNRWGKWYCDWDIYVQSEAWYNHPTTCLFSHFPDSAKLRYSIKEKIGIILWKGAMNLNGDMTSSTKRQWQLKIILKEQLQRLLTFEQFEMRRQDLTNKLKEMDFQNLAECVNCDISETVLPITETKKT